ncbi:MAG: YdcF family protein [Acidobacteriota bacterium]|nr:YdcF family protein [Acidobacteriota bacterium]
MFKRTRRIFLLLTLIVIAGTSACFVNAGRMLVEPPPASSERADVIYVLAGGLVDRWLEGYDLWREGRAPLILLSRGVSDTGSERLEARGIHIPDGSELARDAMVQKLGVPAAAVELVPYRADNTAQEAAALQRLAAARGWTRIIVVTSVPHTRRSRMAMERPLAGSGIAIEMRGSRYDSFNASRWWRSRSDVRWVTFELPKLVAYRLGLGE